MRHRGLAVLIPVVLLVAACSGVPAPSGLTTRTPGVAPTAFASSPSPSGEITVTLSDAMRFTPDAITVQAGETVTFVVRNDGVAVHEFFVGTEEDQADHAAEMAMGAMSHGHDNALSLKAGERGSLTMTFPEAASLLIGCHEPGHYEAGMKATLTVVD